MSICKDYEAVLTILADYMNGRSSTVELTPEVIALAEKHQISAIIYDQLKDAALNQAYLFTVYRYVNRLVIEKEVAGLLDAANIHYFFVKGNDVAAYYPNPKLRTMGDSDVVVDDARGAWDILMEHGYTGKQKEYTCEWPCYKNNYIVELQPRLVYTGSGKTLVFFDQCWKYETNHHLDRNFHFVYLIEHLRKHLVSESVGLRQFMDLAVILKNASAQMDWKWIRAQLEMLDLLHFTEVCFAFVHRWFEVPLPFTVPEITEEFYDFATNRIMENGVFGRADPKANTNNALTIKQSGSENRFIHMLQFGFHNLFPSYQQLIGWKQYSFLKGRKYLLPVCWVYRLFRNAFSTAGREKFKIILRATGKQDAGKNEELRSWGL